jgi:hypothetical protein
MTERSTHTLKRVVDSSTLREVDSTCRMMRHGPLLSFSSVKELYVLYPSSDLSRVHEIVNMPRPWKFGLSFVVDDKGPRSLVGSKGLLPTSE